MTFREVCLAIEGLYEQNEYMHDLMKLSTRIIASAGFNGKAALQAMNKAWPTKGRNNDPRAVSDNARKQLQRLREMDAINRLKEKRDAGRNEANS